MAKKEARRIGRIDCSKAGCSTFRELVTQLEQLGFAVDHFHCVSLIKLCYKPDGKHIEVLENGKIEYYIESMAHLRLTPTESLLAGRRLDGYWNCPSDLEGFRTKLEVNPNLFDKVVADEAHD